MSSIKKGDFIPESQDILHQVSKFVKGSSYDSKLPTEERVKSAITLLRTLPSTRYAVLEYFASIYDDAIFRLLSPIESEGEEAKNEIVSTIQSSMLDFIHTNPVAWAPIYSAWCIELLGQLSSKYSSKLVEKKGLSHSASLNELLQLWLSCYCTKSLIEIATQCIATMVGDTPDSCVDALLETSVRHSPHFDWVVAHIGSCFPRTIIERVLMCGLKDYVIHARSQSASSIDDKMPKFKSVVDILGHLAAQHARDIKHALLRLFHSSLETGAELTDAQYATVPFLLQLGSMSLMLLHVFNTEFIHILTTDVLNKLAELSGHWFKKSGHDEDSLLTLAVHLVTISDHGTLHLLQLLLDTAYPVVHDTDAMETDDVTSDKVIVTSLVQKCSRQILDRVLLDLSRFVHSKCGESSVDVPFLKGLQQHISTVCSGIYSATGERQTCLCRIVKYVAISSSESIASHVLSQILLQASDQQQMEYWLELQVELQIKHPSILSSSIHELLSELVQGRHNTATTARALKNILMVLQWETQPSNITRYKLSECLESHVHRMSSLIRHHHTDVSMVTLQILDIIKIADMLVTMISHMCSASVNFLLRALASKDIKQKFTMCSSCRKFVKKLVSYASAQKTLVRLLLEAALQGECRKYLGGTFKLNQVKISSTELAQPGLLSDVRQSDPMTLHKSHGGVIGQGLRPSVGRNTISPEEIQHNRQQFVDILWTVACHSNTSSSQQKSDKNESESHDRKLSSHMAKTMALMMIELLTPDVMYNGIPWPEEEFMKVTIERDLAIRKQFEENPVLWDVFDFLSTGIGAMCYCSAIIRGLMATLIYYWDSCRDAAASSSPWQLQASISLISYMKKGHFLPVPLCYCGELLEHITPHQVCLLLTNIWRFMKEKPPVPEQRDWGSIDVKHTEVIRSVLHHNIDKFAHLYARFFPCAQS